MSNRNAILHVLNFIEADADVQSANAMLLRRFPPPWSIDELEACFVVIDSTGQKLAYVYFEDEPGPVI